jgi:acetyl esterase/lipase
MKTNILHGLIAGCFLLTTGLGVFSPDFSAEEYLAVEENVSFEQVLALATREPQAEVSYGDDPLQYGLLWTPDSAEAAPLVILIHGGCWLNNFDVNHSRPLASALSQAGFAVWSLEYRRTGDSGGGWPGTLADIRLALSQLDRLKLIENQSIDFSRIAVAGHSAGGHLALMAGAELPAARAIIGLAAIVDIESYSLGNNSCQQAAPLFMGTSLEQARELYALANPVKQPLHPKSLLLHGGSDDIVPLDHFKADVLPTSVVTGAGHFDWIHPGTAAYRLLLNTLHNRLTL